MRVTGKMDGRVGGKGGRLGGGKARGEEEEWQGRRKITTSELPYMIISLHQ